MPEINSNIYEIINDFRKEMNGRFDKVETKIETDFVRKVEFAPVKTIAFTLVGIIVVAVISAVIALVIKQPIRAAF